MILLRTNGPNVVEFSIHLDVLGSEQTKRPVTLRVSIKRKPTIDLCMKSGGQTTLIDPTLEKVGGQLTPLTP